MPAPEAAGAGYWRERAMQAEEQVLIRDKFIGVHEAAIRGTEAGLDVERLDDAIAAFYGHRLPRSSAEGIAAEYRAILAEADR